MCEEAAGGLEACTRECDIRCVRRVFLLVALVAAALVAFGGTASASGCTVTWVGDVDDRWYGGSETDIRFRIDVADGASQSFRVRLSDGYDSGERPLASGDVRIRPATGA